MMQRFPIPSWLAKTLILLYTICAADFLLLFIWFNSDKIPWLLNIQSERGHLRDWLSRSDATATQDLAASTKQDEWNWAKDVSIVYTWVNGSDPDLTAKRVQYGGPESSGLYRDHDDLRYSLKTWVNNSAWHRGMIFIVSETAPTWLNESHPRVKWICQDDLLPRDVTPTFSNYVVEQFLHLIPGLSDQFIHMNDDYMIERPTHPSDFFTASGGPKYYFDNAFISPEIETSGGSHWLTSLWTTVNLIDEQHAQGNKTSKTRYRYLKHAPYVYHRGAFFEIHARFQEALLKTSHHRFRTPGDILWPYLYYGFVVNEGQDCCGLDFEFVRDGPGKAFLMMWSTNMEVNREAMKHLEARTPLFLTINDDMGVKDQDAIDIAHDALLRFYEGRYGHLAGVFEKYDGSEHSPESPRDADGFETSI